MDKLNSLKKEAQQISSGTLLAGYTRSDFLRVAEREFLLLQHLSPEMCGIIIQHANENYFRHLSTNIADYMLWRPSELKSTWMTGYW